MIQKHRISTKIGEDQKVVVDLKQNFDLLEILSLKFTQKEVYASLCADYGVVCGRITANNGLGIPNAKISIFVPLNSSDENDPVISALYPYRSVSDRNENNYRYNLLPSRKQHSGHTPTGTFFDQSDILTRQEVLEVYEKYYSFTVKTNSSGDFMIWGVPIGQQTIHVDVDLSDMGCFSLRPYDFIRQGTGPDKFDRFYNFKSSDDIDGLPQIATFSKTIEVYPFWGNEELCEIGITRTDFDLSYLGIKIEPIALILVSTITDDNKTAIKRNGKIRKEQGYKCNLQTAEGTVECVRFTGNKVYGSDNTTLYPELEYFEITESIEEDGSAMIVLPMNMEYLYTNEFGEEEITNDPNKGVPTTTIARFKFNLTFNDRKKTTGSYLVPNIREYNNLPTIATGSPNNETDEHLLTTYRFSDVFEDYLTVTELTPSVTMLSSYKEDKRKKMTGEDNNNIPEDYFYKFIFGKVYTVSQFHGSHVSTSGRDAFLGIKEIRPNIENDCSTSTNYVPVNFAYRNRLKFSIIISQILLFLEYILNIVQVKFNEAIATGLFYIGLQVGRISNDGGERLVQYALKVVENGQKVLPLVTYPDCETCTADEDSNTVNQLENVEQIHFRSAEVKTLVIPSDGYINLVFLTSQSPNWFSSSTTTGTTFLTDLFPTDSSREIGGTAVTENDLNSLHLQTTAISNEDENYKYVAQIYPIIGIDDSTDTFNPVGFAFKNFILPEGPISSFFSTQTTQFPSNSTNTIRATVTNFGYSVDISYVDISGAPIPATENITVQILIRKPCFNVFVTRIYTIPNGSSTVTAALSYESCPGGGGGIEKFERIIPPISGSTSGVGTIREYNTNTSEAYTGPTLRFTYNQWAQFGLDYFDPENDVGNIRDLYAIVRIYDVTTIKNDAVNPEIVIEQGCSKYDKFYDENVLKAFIWAPNGTDYDDPAIYYPPNFNPNADKSSSGYQSRNIVDNRVRKYNSQFKYGRPLYESLSNFRESLTSPGPNYTLLSSVVGRARSLRLPYVVRFSNLGETINYSKKTKSGLSEIRDGVITIVPNIGGGYFESSLNSEVLKEWYKRKRIGLLFCSGIVNYSFIDNWLNGLLYFFKFDRRIKWDNEEEYDLNKAATKYPENLVFYNVIDKNFYYRSTPYDPINGFKGQRQISPIRKEILFPTTFYDVGVRDEFLKEICVDPRLDPTCSVIRDIGATSYQDIANIVEYAINTKLDLSDNAIDVEDFFNKNSYMGTSIDGFNGDINQLMSINSEAGIEAFDLDSAQYFHYNGEIMDPEDSKYSTYFNGPTAIDIKFDDNGKFIRECLNFRLGDYSQVVPFYLWNKNGTGFGPTGTNQTTQEWDKTNIATMKLQRIFSIENYGDTTTNYVFDDGEEEYLLRPMTKDHETFVFENVNISDNLVLERFEVISSYAPDVSAYGASAYTEGNLWLHVTNGTTTAPLSGRIYVVLNETWTQDELYVKDTREVFLFSTLNNYTGNKQVLSTPFHFYFGLRPGNTAFDKFIKYFGPKLPRTFTIFSGSTGTTAPPEPPPSPSPTVTPSVTITPSITISITPTQSPLLSMPPTPSLTPSNFPLPSVTPTPTITPSLTPSISITPSLTPSVSITPSVTPSITPSPSFCACTPGDEVRQECIGASLYSVRTNCDCSEYYVNIGPCI